MNPSNHGWRESSKSYALEQDIRLQLEDTLIQIAMKELAIGDASSRNPKDDRQRLLILEDKYKERLDDEALLIAPSSWRLRERMKTGCVALVVALNIGTDPPDVVKTDPCARMECWVDPSAHSPSRALEMIARNLQSQFEFWQTRARYKYILDPSVDSVKKLCTSMRKNAKDERVLFHFNGHGVPRPNLNGEIWVFNADYTQYIPLSIFDVITWTEFPAIYTFDCSCAGALLPCFLRHLEEAEHNEDRGKPKTSSKETSSKANECIVLLACAANEVLPSSPDFPADIFTSCLTTPIKIGLRWFVMSNKMTMDALNITVDMVDRVPGKLNDRKTPLGELNWIFTAITDTIAWTLLPRHLFRKLFRQDILVASLFRNYLLAERILKSVHCTPQSFPSLPPAWQHHLWQAWDMAVENCLTQLFRLVPSFRSPRNDEMEDEDNKYSKSNGVDSNTPITEYVYRQSDFFSNQLTSFEVWLTSGENQEMRRVPEQLPIVLQLSLSSVHRLRALDLLARFLNLGRWAVSLALSVGIFPYVNKLLISPDDKIRPVLIHIWCKILALDSSCQTDLVKDTSNLIAASRGPKTAEGGNLYFLNQLRRFRIASNLHQTSVAVQTEVALEVYYCIEATFVLCVMVNGHSLGQHLCLQQGFLTVAKPILAADIKDGYCELLKQQLGHLKEWLNITLGKLLEKNPAGRSAASGLIKSMVPLLHDENLNIVQACLYAFGMAIGTYIAVEPPSLKSHTQAPPRQPKHAPITSNEEQIANDCFVARAMLSCLSHGSAVVRRELVLSLARFVVNPFHAGLVQLTAHELDLAQTNLMESGTRDFSTDDPRYRDLFNKITRMIGVNAETYLLVWLAVKHLSSSDPFPAVQQTALFLYTFVRDGVKLRIGAIRSRAGIDLESSRPAPVEEDRRTTEEQLEQLGLCSSLHDRRAKILSQPSPVSVDGNWVQVHNDLMRDPLGRQGQYLLSCIRRNAAAAEASSLLMVKAGRWAGVEVVIEESETTRRQVEVTCMTSESDSCDSYITRRTGSPVRFKSVDPPAEKAQKRLEKLVKSDVSLLNIQHSSWAASKRIMFDDTSIAGERRLDELAHFDHGQIMSSKVMFHPYEPVLIVTGQVDDVSVWRYPEERVKGQTCVSGGRSSKYLLNGFSNNGKNARISSVLWLNENADPLLCIGSDDGTVRIWRQVLERSQSGCLNGVRLAGAFAAMPELKAGKKGSGMVLSWQPRGNHLICAGKSSDVSVWDLMSEKELGRIALPSDRDITCVSSYGSKIVSMLLSVLYYVY